MIHSRSISVSMSVDGIPLSAPVKSGGVIGVMTHVLAVSRRCGDSHNCLPSFVAIAILYTRKKCYSSALTFSFRKVRQQCAVKAMISSRRSYLHQVIECE